MAEANSIWVFGYGSLLWGTGDVRPVREQIGHLEGWHRDWTWISASRHGAPTCSLVRGGRVKGKFFNLNPTTTEQDIEYFRRRERPGTEQEMRDVPRHGARAYYWTMGSNLRQYPELARLDGEELLNALARRAKGVTEVGCDGVSAVEYIRRVHEFDPGDERTAALFKFLDAET